MGRPGRPLAPESIDRVIRMLHDGTSWREIRRQVDICNSTIRRIRIGILRLAREEYSPPAGAEEATMAKGRKGHGPRVREAVQLLLSQGLSFGEIAQRLKIGKSTVADYARPATVRRYVLAKPKPCPQCHAMIRLAPCVLCVPDLAGVKTQYRRPREPEELDEPSIELAGEELDRYLAVKETRPR